MNECNNIHIEAFEQLEVRTKDFVFLDWNPSHEFWFYTDILGKRDDVEHLILTYKDNEALPVEIVEAIEKRKNNQSWWKVYGEGQLGEVEGRIYTNWEIIEEIPHFARLERRGLDFGYTTDPTAIVDIYKYNNGFILDEQCYLKGLSNKRIADLLNGLHENKTLVYADCAEPKSIQEIRDFGVNILPVTKGPDSIRQGIQFIQDQKIYVTARSQNLLKEYRNYLWKVDNLGKTFSPNIPIDYDNHLMDAIRYGFNNYNTQPKPKPFTPTFTHYQNKLRYGR